MSLVPHNGAGAAASSGGVTAAAAQQRQQTLLAMQQGVVDLRRSFDGACTQISQADAKVESAIRRGLTDRHVQGLRRKAAFLRQMAETVRANCQQAMDGLRQYEHVVRIAGPGPCGAQTQTHGQGQGPAMAQGQAQPMRQQQQPPTGQVLNLQQMEAQAAANAQAQAQAAVKPKVEPSSSSSNSISNTNNSTATEEEEEEEEEMEIVETGAAAERDFMCPYSMAPFTDPYVMQWYPSCLSLSLCCPCLALSI